MNDLYVFLEKLYTLRGYAISRRFLPVVAVIFFTVVAMAIGLGDFAPNPGFKLIALLLAIILAGVLWVSATFVLPHERRWLKHAEKMIGDCDFENAERTLTASPPLIGFAAHIKRLAALIYLKVETGDLVAAYSLLLAVEQGTLLPNERISLQLRRANLMYQGGNYTAFSMTLSKLDTGAPMSVPLRFRYALLKSHEHELNGRYSLAKELLENVIEMAPEQEFIASVYNNLARLEDIQGNDTNAQSYYERAWQLLRVNPMPKLYPVVGHNLLLKYSKNNAVQKAKNLLTEYRGMVSPGNTQQYLQFLNDQLHLARQLDDRSMVLENYKEYEQVLMPLIDPSQRLALAVSGLRMRFNDGVPLADQVTQTVSLLDESKDLPIAHKSQALSELLGVLQQCNAKADGQDFREVEEKTIQALLGMEDEIEKQLSITPPALPIIRDMWCGHIHRICKLKIRLSVPNLSRSDFDKMFDLLQQRRRTWTDKGHPAGELDALISVCDEFVAYAVQLGPRFANEYEVLAQQALSDAVQILDRHWPHPAVHKHALEIAYFYWQLAGDRENAERWLLRFEKLKLNPAHYAQWFRQWHVEVRGWLTSEVQRTTDPINRLINTSAVAPNPDKPGAQ